MSGSSHQGVLISMAPVTAITLVASNTYTIASGASTVDLTLPGTPLENDIVLVTLVSDTLLISSYINTAGYTVVVTVGGSSPGNIGSYKRMSASPDTVVNIDQDGFGNVIAAVITVWRGVNTGTAVDATATTGTNSIGMPQAPSYTTVTANAMRVIIGFLDDDDCASSVTAPSGFGNLVAGDTGQGSTSLGSTVMVASALQAAAGALAPAAFGGTGSDAWVGAHFAWRPV